MKVSSVTFVLALLAPSISALFISRDIDPEQVEKDAEIQLNEWATQARESALAALDAEVEASRKLGVEPSCTRETVKYRMEFGSIPQEQRKAYTDAVRCLQTSTKKTPDDVAPGARSRYDDFIVTHIYQTPYVHASGTFLGWHRWYMYQYDLALRTECGYTGPTPYWEWSKWAKAPQDSPMFNGDEYSMGGNGEFIPGHEGITFPGGALYLPPGLGGGCIQTGPFVNYTVNLGPINLPGTPPGPDNGLGYNPRCHKRDVGPAVAMLYTNYTSVMKAMVQPAIGLFQDTLQESDGVHGGGHYTIAGDPGGDVYVSPGDPAFYLHHGQIDRLWTIWQAQDPSTRQFAIDGTNTMYNIPPSENTTLDFQINLGYANGPNITMQNVMSTIKGPFCYVYV